MNSVLFSCKINLKKVAFEVRLSDLLFMVSTRTNHINFTFLFTSVFAYQGGILEIEIGKSFNVYKI